MCLPFQLTTLLFNLNDKTKELMESVKNALLAVVLVDGSKAELLNTIKDKFEQLHEG